MTTPRSDATGPVSLSTILDGALQRLEAARTRDSGPQDGFLFSGNRHEAVPRALFFDRRLTPLERNAWQVCRLMLNDERVVFHTVTEDEALKGTQIVLYVPSKHFISEAGNCTTGIRNSFGRQHSTDQTLQHQS